MKFIPVIFLSLVAVASSRVAVTTSTSTEDPCEGAGPDVYCSQILLSALCGMESFCEEYLLNPFCSQGPEVYCKTTEAASFCRKVTECLTWPDESVSAIQLDPNPTQDSVCSNLQNQDHDQFIGMQCLSPV